MQESTEYGGYSSQTFTKRKTLKYKAHRTMRWTFNTILQNLAQHLPRPKKFSYSDPKIMKAVETLERDGVLYVPNFYSPEEVDEINRQADIHMKKAREEDLGKSFLTRHKGTDMIKWAFKNSEHDWVNKYQKDPFILKVVQSALRYPLQARYSMYQIKSPGRHPEDLSKEAMEKMDESTIYFHIDRAWDVIKTVLLLKDVEEKDGPMLVVKGSHKWFYKAPARRGWRMLKKAYRHNLRNPHCIHPSEEHLYINSEDIVPLAGKKGDLYFANVSGWHCGRYLKPDGERKYFWNVFYPESIRGRLRYLLNLNVDKYVNR